MVSMFGQLESRKTRRNQLVEKQLAENSPAENSSQKQKIISGKYGADLVIIPCYEVLNYYEGGTVNHKRETFQAII